MPKHSSMQTPEESAIAKQIITDPDALASMSKKMKTAQLKTNEKAQKKLAKIAKAREEQQLKKIKANKSTEGAEWKHIKKLTEERASKYKVAKEADVDVEKAKAKVDADKAKKVAYEQRAKKYNAKKIQQRLMAIAISEENVIDEIKIRDAIYDEIRDLDEKIIAGILRAVRIRAESVEYGIDHFDMQPLQNLVKYFAPYADALDIHAINVRFQNKIYVKGLNQTLSMSAYSNNATHTPLSLIFAMLYHKQDQNPTQLNILKQMLDFVLDVQGLDANATVTIPHHDYVSVNNLDGEKIEFNYMMLALIYLNDAKIIDKLLSKGAHELPSAMAFTTAFKTAHENGHYATMDAFITTPIFKRINIEAIIEFYTYTQEVDLIKYLYKNNVNCLLAYEKALELAKEHPEIYANLPLKLQFLEADYKASLIRSGKVKVADEALEIERNLRAAYNSGDKKAVYAIVDSEPFKNNLAKIMRYLVDNEDSPHKGDAKSEDQYKIIKFLSISNVNCADAFIYAIKKPDQYAVHALYSFLTANDQDPVTGNTLLMTALEDNNHPDIIEGLHEQCYIIRLLMTHSKRYFIDLNIKNNAGETVFNFADRVRNMSVTYAFEDALALLNIARKEVWDNSISASAAAQPVSYANYQTLRKRAATHTQALPVVQEPVMTDNDSDLGEFYASEYAPGGSASSSPDTSYSAAAAAAAPPVSAGMVSAVSAPTAAYARAEAPLASASAPAGSIRKPLPATPKQAAFFQAAGANGSGARQSTSPAPSSAGPSPATPLAPAKPGASQAQVQGNAIAAALQARKAAGAAVGRQTVEATNSDEPSSPPPGYSRR